MESSRGQSVSGGVLKLQDRNLGFEEGDANNSKNYSIERSENSINRHESSRMGRPMISNNIKSFINERSGILSGDYLTKKTLINNDNKNMISERGGILSGDCINTNKILGVERRMSNNRASKNVISGLISGDYVDRNEIVGVGRPMITNGRSENIVFSGNCMERNGNEGGFMIGVGRPRRKDKSKRLSVEQVKELERAFKVGDRLGVQRKGELARELGLQARQVAVWFQNKRARCKTKQIEEEFESLKKHMEALVAHRDELSLENEQLKIEVARLKKRLSVKENAADSSPSSSTVLQSEEYSSVGTSVLEAEEEATQNHFLAWDESHLWTLHSNFTNIDPILSFLSP